MGSEYISRTLKNGVRVHFLRVFPRSNPTTTPSDTAVLLSHNTPQSLSIKYSDPITSSIELPPQKKMGSEYIFLRVLPRRKPTATPSNTATLLSHITPQSLSIKYSDPTTSIFILSQKNGVSVHFFRVFPRGNPTAKPTDTATLYRTIRHSLYQ